MGVGEKPIAKTHRKALQGRRRKETQGYQIYSRTKDLVGRRYQEKMGQSK